MIDNVEKSGLELLWSAGITPWTETEPWVDFPRFTQINNIEKS